MKDNYYAMIMAGGGGTRLWPLSRRARPKQSLRLYGDDTLFQTAVKRIDPKELRRLRSEVGKLEKAVTELEAKQADITSALEDPDTYAEVGKALHLNRELTAISDQIQQATKAWEAAASNLENLAGPRAG